MSGWLKNIVKSTFGGEEGKTGFGLKLAADLRGACRRGGPGSRRSPFWGALGHCVGAFLELFSFFSSSFFVFLVWLLLFCSSRVL
jgi:hypothetical protein